MYSEADINVCCKNATSAIASMKLAARSAPDLNDASHRTHTNFLDDLVVLIQPTLALVTALGQTKDLYAANFNARAAFILRLERSAQGAGRIG